MTTAGAAITTTDGLITSKSLPIASLVRPTNLPTSTATAAIFAEAVTRRDAYWTSVRKLTIFFTDRDRAAGRSRTSGTRSAMIFGFSRIRTVCTIATAIAIVTATGEVASRSRCLTNNAAENDQRGCPKGQPFSFGAIRCGEGDAFSSGRLGEGAGCLNCHDLQVVDRHHFSASGFKPKYKKLRFGFSPSAEAYRSFAFLILAEAALQVFQVHDLKVVAI